MVILDLLKAYSGYTGIILFSEYCLHLKLGKIFEKYCPCIQLAKTCIPDISKSSKIKCKTS